MTAKSSRPRSAPTRGARPGSFWIPVGCVLLAFVVRLGALRAQPFVTVDGTEYVRFAEALAAGRGFPSIFPPGYPALIAIVRLLVPDRVLSAALVSLACGSLLPWPTWWLARRAVGDRWAAAPALAVALHPELVRFSAIVMSEAAYFLALYGALAFVAAGRALAGGTSLGLAFAIRPEGLVASGLVALGGLARARRHTLPWRRLAIGCAGFLALAVPCWLWFHATLGLWTPTPKLKDLRPTIADWRTDEPRLTPQAAGSGFGSLETLGRNGLLGLRQYPGNAVRHGRSLFELWPAPLLALSLIGLTRRRGVETVALVALLAIPFLGLSRQPRFVLGAVPALAILATVAVAQARGRWRVGAAALALAGVAIAGVTLGPRLVRPFEGWFDAHERAGRWLSGVAEPDAVVMDRKPYVAFYANRTYRVMPDEPYETLVRYAVGSGVRYLVVDQKVAEVYRRQLEPLLYDEAFREREGRLELVYVGGREVGYGLGIFRVLRPGERKTGAPPELDARWLREPPAR